MASIGSTATPTRVRTAGFNQDSTVLPVLAYENLPADEEMNLFIDINSKQVKVSTGLLVELYADLHWRSSDPEEAFQALLSRITSRLNSVRGPRRFMTAWSLPERRRLSIAA